MRTITLCFNKTNRTYAAEDTELLAKIDNALQKVRDSGEYKAIFKKYFAH